MFCSAKKNIKKLRKVSVWSSNVQRNRRKKVQRIRCSEAVLKYSASSRFQENEDYHDFKCSEAVSQHSFPPSLSLPSFQTQIPNYTPIIMLLHQQ